MHLVRLTYFSENRLDPIAGPVLGALQDILSASQRNNRRDDITGALAFDDLWFFQALEGERSKVWNTFQRIARDPRHGAVALAECRPIESGLFPNWSMRLARRTPEMQPIFDPYMIGDRLDPTLMSGTDIERILVAVSAKSGPSS